MRKLYVLLLIILTFFCCTTNTIKKDISSIIALQQTERNSIIDSSLIYLKQAQILIDKHKNIPDTLKIENIFRKGYYYLQTNKLDSAAYYFHRSIDLIAITSKRKRNLVYFGNTWETDQKRGDYKNGIIAANKFIKIAKNSNHYNGLFRAYNFMENAYLSLNDYDKALKYNELASSNTLKNNDIDNYVITGNSKAKILHGYLKKKEEAYKLLDSLATINCGINAKQQLYRDLGILNFNDKNYKASIRHYKKAIDLSKKKKYLHNVEYQYAYHLLESYNNIAEAYLYSKNYEVAKKYLDSSKIMISKSPDARYINFYNKLRFKLNYNTTNDEKALLKEYEGLIQENKNRYQQNIDTEIRELKLSHEREQKILLQKTKEENKNIILVGVSSFLGLLIIIGYLFYRQRQVKFEKENLQIQQRLLRSQMNPHFIFNTLSLIQNKIKENQKDAVNYLLKFSRLLRLILENSLSNYVLIENELESLKKYLDLQLIRFPNKFKYFIELENFEDDEMIFIPPMLIQPFVENSIQHAFYGINVEGEIKIKLSLKENWISCRIEDNGIGLKSSYEKTKVSLSTSLISKFILKSTKKNIQIIDKKTNDTNTSGVIVSFLIPYKFNKDD